MANETTTTSGHGLVYLVIGAALSLALIYAYGYVAAKGVQKAGGLNA